MKIVSWNIRAGGGKQAVEIARQLIDWQPDIVVLSEFRMTPPSCEIEAALYDFGLRFSRKASKPESKAENTVFISSRWPMRRVRLNRAPNYSSRWNHVHIQSPQPVAVVGVHVPNRSSGKKYPFLDATLNVAKNWRGVAGIIVGDTNSGRIGIDEQNPAFNQIEDRWVQSMQLAGWQDAFRKIHQDSPGYTWYSPNMGNGFRLDQAFVNRKLMSGLHSIEHIWGKGDEGQRLSDHAAIIMEFQFTM